MLEQKTNLAMSLECIENVQSIDDLTAESVNAGSFKLELYDNPRNDPNGWFLENTIVSNDNHHSFKVNNFLPGKTDRMVRIVGAAPGKQYDVKLLNADTGRFLAYTHQGPLTIGSDGNSTYTEITDEMEAWYDGGIRKNFKVVVQGK